MTEPKPVIVLGTDFSTASEPALKAAIDSARKQHGRIALVHALTPLGAPGLDLERPPVRPHRNESADPMLERAAQAWVARCKEAGIACEVVTRPGLPADVILEEARRLHAAAIVVGSHGRGRLGKALLGSVADQVLAKAHVPVFVIPGHAAA